MELVFANNRHNIRHRKQIFSEIYYIQSLDDAENPFSPVTKTTVNPNGQDDTHQEQTLSV